MIRCEKIREGAYKIDVMGTCETIADEYIALTDYLGQNIPEVIVAATEAINKKLEG